MKHCHKHKYYTELWEVIKEIKIVNLIDLRPYLHDE
jgi:hypothetical protein